MAINGNNYRVTITFTETVLGAASLNKDVYSEYIASRVTGVDVMDEINSLPDAIEKGTTGFHRTADGKPAIFNYVVKGFLKEAASSLARVSGTVKIPAFRKVIDGLVFVSPRLIVIETDEPVGTLERPLRAQTAQGERVALANSETVAAGATATFTLTLLDAKLEDAVRAWLDYGEWKGMGQWRNAGHGTFTYTMERID